MRRALWVLAVWSVVTWFGTPVVAETPTEADVRAEIARKYPEGLPKYVTPEERMLPRLVPDVSARELRTPPSGSIYCPPEYAACEGLLFAWESYTDVITAMIVPMTNNDPPSTAFVVVDSTSEQSTVSSSLNSAGADMAHVEFIVRTTDAVWIRDYGPRFIFEDGIRAIVDHTYNRPSRPNDNLLNDYISSLWGEAQYDIPLEHGGGNFHLFANGDAFMTNLILTENPGESEQDVIDLYHDYQNVDLTIYPGFPTSFDSTQHIDMWMFPVADDKIIIGQYSSSTGQPYTISENAVTDLVSRGYTVYRTPGWNSGGTHYTYTNAVICNDQVFVPRFNVSQDSTALSVFQTAFAGYELIQVDCSDIIHAAGAMHCIVMHVPEALPDPVPAVHVMAPNGGEVWSVGQEYEIAWEATDDVAVTGIDLYYSTDGGASYPHPIATGEANDGVHAWVVPDALGDELRVRVIAHDADLNSGVDESDGDFEVVATPVAFHSFPLDTDPGWSCDGAWAFGVPQGGGVGHGSDPTSGHTGTNVYGYNLAGDYTNNMPEYYLTSTPLDCTGLSGVELRFWRWLGVEAEHPDWDHATVEVSNDGTEWIEVWTATGANVSDDSWVQMVLDISAVADDQPTVYLRWVMGTSDYSVTFPGWNIDDIVVAASCGSDLDHDGDVDLADYARFSICLNGPNVLTPPPGATAAEFAAADLDGDGDVDMQDYAVFEASFTG